MQQWIAATVAGVGLALMGYMIVVEDEPGALPLALLVVGAVWFYLARRRQRHTRGATGK